MNVEVREYEEGCTSGLQTGGRQRLTRVNEGASTSGLPSAGAMAIDSDDTDHDDDDDRDDYDATPDEQEKNTDKLDGPTGREVGDKKERESVARDEVEPEPLDPGNRFSILGETLRHVRRFDINGRELNVKINIPDASANPLEWLEGAFKDLHTYVTATCHGDDYIGFIFHAESFNEGSAWLSFRPVRDSHYSDLWKLVSSVTQSAAEFEIDKVFTVTVHIVRVPTGRGRALPMTHAGVMKKSIVRIVNTDGLCLPRALVVAEAHAERGSNRSGALHERYEAIRYPGSRLQRAEAQQLVERAGVEIPGTGCGMLEISRFQDFLAPKGLAIVIYELGKLGTGDAVFYNGTASVTDRRLSVTSRLNILYNPAERHFDAITSLTGASAGRFFCEGCNKKFNKGNDHRCSHRCPQCLGTPQCDSRAAKLECPDCRRVFRGNACLDRHRKEGSFSARQTVCLTLRSCVNCSRLVNLNTGPHSCETRFCRTCNRSRPHNHFCFMAPLKTEARSSDCIFIFYDFETQQSQTIRGDPTTNVHVPNLCVVQQVCTRCIGQTDIKQGCNFCGLVREFVFRTDPVRELVEFATRPVQGFSRIICIAHNSKGFDCQFILRWIVERDVESPTVILNGSKIIMLETGRTRFLDSLSYMPMPLSALPKAFGLPDSAVKGVFPHFFNTPENIGYVGPLPAARFYAPDSMSSAARAAFYDWYNDAVAKNYTFNFDLELVAYCKSDVDILRRACIAFRAIFLECGGVCPFTESTTIASACSAVFRKKFLQPDHIGILPPGGYRLADRQSQKALKWLVWMERELGRTVLHAGRSREYRIPETGRQVDGYYVDRDGTRHVLEFHGCFFHGCRRCFRINRDRRLVNGFTLDARAEETLAKTSRMKQLGYSVTEIWECAFDREFAENENMRQYLARHPLTASPAGSEALNPRDAFYGGRTGNTSRYRQIAADAVEQIRYVDVCSLYPWVCKNGRFPVGHPTVYVGDECKLLTGPTGKDISRVEGLIKCRILPPRKLYHPVLPLRMHDKLMFALCYSCCLNFEQNDCPHDDSKDRQFEGTWVSVELKKAVEMGYEILSVQEIWHYAVTSFDPVTRQGGLFAAYIDTFLKMKQEASGWPAECVDDVTRARYLAEYERVEGIRLDEAKIEKNPGLRSVSKLCLNSFWGKFGQRENLTKTSIVKTRQQLLELMTDPEIELQHLLTVNENVLYVRWAYARHSVAPSPLANVVIAAYTTAQARLKLYSYLERLDRRVLYYDTDSVIYTRDITRPKDYEPPTGNFLGDLTDELNTYGDGSYIRSFVSGGPKFYAFIVRRADGEEIEVCKVKGITLNYTVGSRVNFESIRRMVVEGANPIEVKYRAIRTTAMREVVTRTEKKTCRPVFLKRRCLPGNFDTLPYGYRA